MRPFTEFLLEFFSDDAKNAIKLIERGQVKKAEWKMEKDWGGTSRKVAVVELHDGAVYDIVPYAVTTYAKQGKLRVSGKTKKEVYIDIGPSRTKKEFATMPRPTGKVFGKAVGEGAAQDEKIAKARQKAIQWFQKNLGIKLGEFDFRYK